MRRLRRHLPDRLHHLCRERRRSRTALPPECARGQYDAGPVRVHAAQHDAGDGQGRGRVPALRVVRRALSDRGMGHAEVPAAGDACRLGMPDASRRGGRVNGPAAASMDGPAVQALAAINDFVVKFANVNGSGSASANELFAKAILRMGVPVSPRNIFPSNIQGLPTWYEVRVSERGWLGRRGGADLMVAMNPPTWDEDSAAI